MSTYWEITLSDIKPLPGKADELLSILKEYRFNIYYDIGTRFDASFYDWRSYDLADDLCADIAPLIESGTMHAKCDEDDEDDGVMTVFKNGACKMYHRKPSYSTKVLTIRSNLPRACQTA